jgi:hypothetical protein
MTQSTDEAREKRLRKQVQKRGYLLRKFRSRTPGHQSYGKFMIVNPAINGAVAGHEPFPYSLNLDQVDSWLEQNGRR